MKEKYLKAYEFYKTQYPESVLLFHIGNSYYAFQSDACIVANIKECCLSCLSCNYKEDLYWCGCHQDQLENICSQLRKQARVAVTIVDYRNSQGSFDVPKVKQILQDMEDDY